MEKKLYTIAVYSENHVGLLGQITIIFTRRQLNIESLSSSASARDGIHKTMITAETDEETIINIVKQMERRVDVIRAYYYDESEVISQEIALYKVLTKNILSEGSIDEIVRKYNVRILEINETFTILEKSGLRCEITELFDTLNRYEILQFVSSGRVSVTRSKIEEVSLYVEEQEERRRRVEGCSK